MSTQLRSLLAGNFDQLRYEPTAKRIRAELAGRTVADTTGAALVWEPRRAVPSYAVPRSDVDGDLVPASAGEPGDVPGAGPGGGDRDRLARLAARPVLDPRVPFTVHTTEGLVVDLEAAGQHRPAAGFLPGDPDLAGLVVLDFAAFDAWYEEDERNVSHPRDPFHRIDVLPSSRRVRLELDGQVLAESARPMLLFETLLPTRYYLPRADVTAELAASPTRTWCAYKGQASYFAVTVAGRPVPDLAWTYVDPRPDATLVQNLIAFFDERIDVIVDGKPQPRPVTPWSQD